MQAIRRKLNSQKGASMLMALLLMLVGIMVSAVIISAATSAAVNKRSEKEQQQAYLAGQLCRRARARRFPKPYGPV